MSAQRSRPSPFLIPMGLLAAFALVVCFSIIVYPPDRPVATIDPGSSSVPTFAVQIIRPRLGLPLAGILPPQLFGLDEHLGFDSTSVGAVIGRVNPRHLELAADDWELILALDADGRVTSDTRVVFNLLFQERLRKVSCRPGEPAVGTHSTTALADTDELSGSFDIELPRCEDADTGKPLGWPTKPLVLHGSYDRLSPGIQSPPRGAPGAGEE